MFPERISNHTEQCSNLLLSQFKQKENIEKLLAVYGKQIQEIEDEYWTLIESLGIESATLYGLDLIGKEVGEARQGRNDDDYREAIILRIIINHSSGTPEEVITAAKQVTGADKVNYSEQYPAGVVLEVLGANYTAQAPIIRKTVPAGVDLIFRQDLLIDQATTNIHSGYTEIVNFDSFPETHDLFLDYFMVGSGRLTTATLLEDTAYQDFIVDGFTTDGIMSTYTILRQP